MTLLMSDTKQLLEGMQQLQNTRVYNKSEVVCENTVQHKKYN